VIIVITQGHSASRLIASTLRSSGVWMGHPINSSCDLVPEGWPKVEPPIYEAARICNRHVRPLGPAAWYYQDLIKTPPSDAWWVALYDHIHTVAQHTEPAGWKIPETLFSLPWLIHRFPDAHYIHWMRDPRDVISGRQAVSNYELVNIPHNGSTNPNLHRAIAWKYQHDLVVASPKPKRWLRIRFEDFATNQDRELRRLSEFLNLPLIKVPVRTEPVNRWRKERRAFDPAVTDLLRGGIS